MTGATYFIGEVGEARGKFGSFVQEVERSLGDLQRAIERLEQQRRRAVRQERLALLLDLMSRRAEEIDELAGGFLLGIERAIAVGERLMSSAVDSRDRLGEGRSRLLQPEELQAIRALCALRAGAALRERARLGPAGVETPGDSRPRTRFKALLGQFKVLSYKTIAGQAAGVEVESGGQGGELTLF